MNSKQNQNLNKFIKISLLGAMAVVLMYFEFPIPFSPFTWLKIDLGDIPALIGGFAFGPLAAITIQVIKNILFLIVKGGDSGLIGPVANLLIGTFMVVPVALMHKIKKGNKSLLIGMGIGFIVTQILGILVNVYILLPVYGMVDMSTKDLVNYISVGLIPFNGIKTIMVYLITYMLYKRVGNIIFKDKI